MLNHPRLLHAVVVCLSAASGLYAAEPSPPVGLRPHLLVRHPHAKVLLQEVSLPDDNMSLLQLKNYLESKFGLKVVIDESALEEESISPEELFRVPPLKNVLLLNVLHEYLDKIACTIVEEPGRVLITTKTNAISVHSRVLFHVQDLVSAEPKFDLAEMHDPIFNRNEAYRLRIEAKLKALVTWQLKNASINDVIKKLRTELAENVTINVQMLEEESIDLDTATISCDYQNVPLKDVLRWVLESQHLCHFTQRESIRITTLTEGVTRRPLRTYAVRDLLFRDVHPERATVVAVTPQWNGPGAGWLGGFSVVWFGSENHDPFSKIGPVYQVGENYYRHRQPEFWFTPKSLIGAGESLSAPDSARFTQDNASKLLNDIEMHTGGPPNHPWYGEGEGGALGIYYPSFSVVVRQTEQTHAEISDYLGQMRALQARYGTNPEVIALTTKDATARSEKAGLALMTLLQGLAGGPPCSPWAYPPVPGKQRMREGGTVSYDRTLFALTIQQTTPALDEIAGLLVRLRRERYELFHDTHPPETGTAGNQLPTPALNNSK